MKRHNGYSRRAALAFKEERRALKEKEIQDHADYENPHQYSTGVIHVFVNGQPVLENGEHTGATPGRVLRGPGWKP